MGAVTPPGLTFDCDLEASVGQEGEAIVQETI